MKYAKSSIHIYWTFHIYVYSFFFTFDNNYVGHNPSTIDVAPISAAADAQRVANVPHLGPVARVMHPPRRSSRESRCLSQKENNVCLAMHNKRID